MQKTAATKIISEITIVDHLVRVHGLNKTEDVTTVNKDFLHHRTKMQKQQQASESEEPLLNLGSKKESSGMD